MDRGPTAFYDLETEELRPQYAWYLNGMRRVGALAEEITQLGDSLVADLKVDDEE